MAPPAIAKDMFNELFHGVQKRLTAPKVAGVGVVFLWFFLGGIAHFVATQTEMRIVPPSIPHARAVVLVSGVFELLGAFGLLWWRTRPTAGGGLFLLTIAVTPAHLYMLQRPELFSIPIWALWLRLPIQLVLLALIAWCTQTDAWLRPWRHGKK